MAGQQRFHPFAGAGGRQGVQIAVVGVLADFGAAAGGRHAFAQTPPDGLAFGAGPQFFEVADLVDRGFDPQHRTLLVVEFQGVVPDAMFDAHAFGTAFAVAGDFDPIPGANTRPVFTRPRNRRMSPDWNTLMACRTKGG